MPNRWAIANGNWSSTATWNSGGSLGIPTGSDDVFANNFTVNVDTSFQVLTLRNSASASAIVAGGTFNFNSGSISASLSNGIVLAQAVNLITVTAGSGTVTITTPANIQSILLTQPVFNHTGNCNFILTAGDIAGSGANSGVINKSSLGRLTVNCNTMTAGIQGHIIASSAGEVVVNGTVAGGSASSNTISLSGGTLFILNGNCVGGSGVAALSTAAATNIITGSVIGGTGAAAISSTTANTITVSGSCIASAINPAVVSTNASAINIFTGPFINTNNTMAVQCVDMMLTQDTNTSWNFGDITLFSPGRLAFYPSASDIRQGVTYADGTVSGSLAIPPPTAVIAGTPTDNTTGSAVLTPEQLQDAVWGRDLSQMTETGSIGYRLAKSATTDSTGNQLASYLI